MCLPCRLESKDLAIIDCDRSPARGGMTLTTGGVGVLVGALVEEAIDSALGICNVCLFVLCAPFLFISCSALQAKLTNV